MVRVHILPGDMQVWQISWPDHPGYSLIVILDPDASRADLEEALRDYNEHYTAKRMEARP